MRTAKELLPTSAELTIVSIADIPLFNEDVEARGAPTIVTEIKDQIAAADALLICTPEYNNGIPGVLKNAIDWVSRPNADMPRVLHGKCFALMGATPSGFGTLNAQTAWLPLIRYFKFRPCFANSLYVSAAHEKFDANLKLYDEATLSSLKKFLADYVTFIEHSTP
ncbi:MAG: NAD(P)H-dependent oxidoreductase [Pseudomonadota bacterium]|nr:NAD(P)H-dependent oxidoreductase [Pseudomonadota bacterium]